MKKILFTSILLLFAVFTFAGKIEKTYYFSSPQIIQKGDYQLINFNNTLNTGLIGQPSFPYQSVSLLLPPGEIASSVEIVCENEVFLPGAFNLYPYQASRPLSDDSKAVFQKNEIVYQSDEAIPVSMNGKLSTSFMNGFGFAFTTFTPIKFIPSEQKVSYYGKITIRITTTPDVLAETALENLRNSAGINEKVNDLAQNPSDMDAYPTNSSRTLTQYDLLIITTESYVDGFAGLVDMYLHRGMKSQIVTKETIIAEGTGADAQEKIRNYIIGEYQSNGIEFVLLGGDVELIPYRGFYAYVVSGSGYEDYGIPSDLYYSALDGNWNTDNDNKWGETDEDDLLPELAVARFPFSNATELASMIHKCIFYQNQPVLGELTSPLLAGEFLYDNPETWGSDYLELLIGSRDDNGYTTIGIPEDNNIQKMYEEETSWSGQDLINAINQGKQFVHHVGHANQTYVAYLSNSDITNTNFSGANGVDHNFTIMQTHGCDCGAFEYSDCILEKMVTIDNFAVAVIGNSRSGWFNEGQTEGPAAHLHREMVDALYTDQINFLGKAMVESKIQTAPWVEAAGQWEEGALRWNFYDLNILGDPALSVWTKEPITIEVGYLSELPIGTLSTVVHVSSEGEPMVNFNCSVLLNGEIIARSFTDSEGNATLEFDPLVVEVCTASLQVVGYNSLPAYYDISFIPDAGPYVIYDSNIINDATGNGDGQADYGEAVLLTLDVKNVGSETGFNVTATISTEDEFAFITDNFAEVADIPAGEIQTLVDAFRFELAAEVPDMHEIQFSLTCTNGTDSWISYFTITAHAPELVVGQIVIFDQTGGNGNGLLDPGETVTINIPCINVGSSGAVECTARLTEDNPYVNINQILMELGSLAAGESKTASFEVSVLSETPIGSLVQFGMRLAGNFCVTEETLFATIGLLIEDFESNTFNSFEWNQGGNAAWIISNDAPFEGQYSARSGIISDEQSSDLWLSLIMASDDGISFWVKVSSETGYDYLRFYVDDVLIGEWSGEVNWSEKTFPVTEGLHILRWSYEKDYSLGEGSDCAWIDKIVFPTTTTVIGIGESISSSVPVIYPNPNEGQFTVNIGNQAKVNEISIFSQISMLVYTTTTADQILEIDLSSLPAGMYVMLNNADGRKSYCKFVVR
jgi:hypothetical protein